MREKETITDVPICEELDRDIEIEEVREVIKKLKRGKAVGIVKYMNEIFMYGGNKIVEDTWLLFNKLFSKEEYPRSWARGLIFPIFKGGPNEDKYNSLKYRGITLLSVLGKLYTAILNQRITIWIEKKGILVE